MSLLALLQLLPLVQDGSYHAFADRRAWLGVANFLNVASNFPFLVVGVIGILRARTLEWRVLFAGVAAVAFGSGYYHLAPDSARLFWDRLPMTVAFMAAFSIVLSERINAPRQLLWPLVLAGVASAVWWRYSGDLRFYVLVQFIPMIVIPILLLLRRGPAAWWGVIGFYGLAKLCEELDAGIYAVGQLVSGHTLKHIAAAVATCWMIHAMGASRGTRTQ